MKFPTKSFAALMILGVSFVVTSAQEKKIKREQLPPAVEKTVARESEGATIKGFASEVNLDRNSTKRHSKSTATRKTY